MAAILNLTTGVVYLVNFTGTITGGSLTLSGVVDVQLTSLGTTSTDGAVVENTTAATAGTPVQISPRLRLAGAAWNSTGAVSEADYWIVENLPATVAGTTTSMLKFGASIAGGAVTYPMTLSNVGRLTTLSTIASGGNLLANRYYGDVNGILGVTWSPSDGRWNIANNAESSGVGLDVTTDSTLAIRNRAQNADVNTRAAFYGSSASTVLTITTNTIAPTNAVHHLGAGLVKTITVPAGFTPTASIDIIPDAAFTTDITGNISLASTAVINRTLRFTWDGTKWNPSY